MLRSTCFPAALLIAGVLAPALGLMRGGIPASAACGSECRAECGVLARAQNTSRASEQASVSSSYQCAAWHRAGETLIGMSHFRVCAPHTRVGELHTRVRDFRARVGELHTRVRNFQTRVREFRTRVRNLHTHAGNFRTRVWDFQTRVGGFPIRVLQPLLTGRVAESESAESHPLISDPPPENPGAAIVASAPTAHELEPNLGWLNTDKPLRLSDELKGHIVVLDFWTYCCINCVHILPDLAALEEQFKNDPVVVIGVHSAKFDNESDRRAIRAAMQRYSIRHPVVVDKMFAIWRKYGAKGWPSFVVIGADGKLVPIPGPLGDDFVASGEQPAKALRVAVANALKDARAAGTLAKAPFRPTLDANVPAPTGLAFPGKVLATEKTPDSSGYLFVSDSTNNRVVQATLPDETGRSQLVAVFGSREPGLTDGAPDTARFRDPQGLAMDRVKNILYVADTKNHAIRAINLKTKQTELLVGDGTQGRDREGGKLGREQTLNSPWDLLLNGDGSAIYVAMAGTHQLWTVALPSRAATALAGGAGEDIIDATAKVARLAQPSGLALSADGARLYFADSEVSAIRSLNFKSNQVRTVIGVGLFEFGDVDGKFPDARLQHPLGVALWPREADGLGGDRLLVADTYNHKIKLIDVSGESSETWIGVGRATPETKKDALVLDEPGGLCLLRASGPPLRDWLFIADTNNHRIIRVDAATKAWVQVQIVGLPEHDAVPAAPAAK